MLQEILKAIKVGDKLYWKEQKKPYIVKARDERYIICIQPFNLRKTVMYSIIDTKEFICGPNNLVFSPYDYKVQNDIDESLKDLENNEYEISFRYRADFLECFTKLKTKNKLIVFADLKA